MAVAVIDPGADEVCQYIIGIGSTYEPIYGHAHQTSIIGSQYVAKVAGRHPTKVHWLSSFHYSLSQQIHIGRYIVYYLRNQTAPVSGVGR